MEATYHVVITNISGSAAETKGFVDNNPINFYALTSDITDTQAQNKRRANIRWKTIVEQVTGISSVGINNMTATGADAKTEATAFSFDVYFADEDTAYVLDNNESPLTGTAAVKYIVALALTIAKSGNAEVLDTGDNFGTGSKIIAMTTGAAAADMATALAAITVTEV